MLVTSCGQDLPELVHLRTPVVLTPSGWLLKHIQWASGRYSFKWNPFLFRVVFRFLKVMQELLDHGAYVDSYAINEESASTFTSTALHVSLDLGLVCFSLFLLMAGADPTIPDKNGNTPFYTIAQQLLQVIIVLVIFLVSCIHFDSKYYPYFRGLTWNLKIF